MIKASMELSKGKLVIFGLSNMNIKKLKEGLPIKIDLKELGISGIEVFIFYGKTEESMKKELEQFIRPELRDGPDIPKNGLN